jgi:hypothetical protein
MTDVGDFGLTVLTSASTSVLLCAVLTWVMRTWISTRLKSSIEHEYEVKVAEMNSLLKVQTDSISTRLKGDIDREADKLKLAAQSFGEVQRAAIAKRLTAIEQTWKAVLDLQASLPPALTYLEILVPSEYVDAKNRGRYGEILRNLDVDAVVMPNHERAVKLEESRPYIGEYLWALFKTYQAVLLRAVYLVDCSKKEPRKILWFEDANIRAYIQSALEPGILSEFDAMQFRKLDWVNGHFNHAILQAMEQIIAGKDFSEAAMKQAESMETRMRETPPTSTE